MVVAACPGNALRPPGAVVATGTPAAAVAPGTAAMVCPGTVVAPGTAATVCPGTMVAPGTTVWAGMAAALVAAGFAAPAIVCCGVASAAFLVANGLAGLPPAAACRSQIEIPSGLKGPRPVAIYS